jgi:hypothetical protein
MLRSHATSLALAILFISISILAVSADEPNVFVEVETFQCPSVVFPDSTFQANLVVRYGVHGEPNNATIRAAVYLGEVNFSNPLWESTPQSVSNGGDVVWNVTLQSPAAEGEYRLTAWAFYLEKGSWQFLNDSSSPSHLQVTIRVGKSASLDVDLGRPNIAVAFDNVTVKTAPNGEAQLTMLIGNKHTISIPPVVELQNSTRLVFRGWSDGINQTQRTVTLHGDMKLNASYRTQYLLTVNSIVPEYSKSDWYNAGANVSLHVDNSIPMDGVLGSTGARYVFRGWSGDLTSNSASVNVVMDAPKTLNADFAADYTSLVIPVILAVGLIGGLVLVALKRKPSTPAPEEEAANEEEAASTAEEGTSSTTEEEKVCENCGEPVEKEWAHCIRCGKALSSEDSIQS